jgi:tetratricopeptide (TPR) repeat protein
VTDRTYRAGRVTGLTSQQEVTAVQGLGGIGKTTLARAFCADCQVRRAFDEIFWVEVGPENGEASVPQLMASIGARFNDDLQHYQQLSMARTSLHRHLSGKRTLIVLDDVWHENVVEHFEWAGVDCRLLITTRNKSLVEDSQPVNKLTTDEGRTLLANLLNQPDLPHTYDALVTRLDGYTLALEIAGKWLKKYRQPLATYLQNLDKDEAKLFDHLQMSKTDKNANLARSLALTYDTLEEDDQTRFRRLGAIAPASTFDEGLLCALWELQADEIMIPLHTLLDVGMLDDVPRTHDDDTPRYTQHALLRAYARALLEQHGETAAAFNRYADHIITVARTVRSPCPLNSGHSLNPTSPTSTGWGINLPSNPPTERMGAFAVNVTGYIHRRPLAIQRAGVTTLRGLNWLEGGLAFDRADANLHRVGVLLHAIGSVFLDMGKIDDALAYFLQVLPLRRDMYDRDGEAATLHQIGSLYLSMGKMDEALTHFQQSLTIKRTLGPRAGEAMTLHSIGTLHLRTGKLDEALTHFQQALTIKRALGDRAGEAATLHQIGSLHLSMGKMDEALMHFQQALTIIRHVPQTVLKKPRPCIRLAVWL